MASCLKEASSNLEQQVVTGPQRKFLLSWKSIFPWAETEDEVVFCRDCRKAGLRDEFALGKIRPPKGWKKEYLRRHALSDNHSKHAIATAKTDSSVFKAPRTVSASEKEVLGLLIDTHFLASNGLSMNKSAALHSLVDFQLRLYSDDVDDDDAILVSQPYFPQFMSKSHRSSYSTWEFIHSLNAVIEDEDIRLLKSACFFSLLLDESNDISTTKFLMIYVQYVNKRNGTLDQKYITNIPLIECDAIGISSAVVNFFETKNVPLSKVVMLTTDGAAVMLGCNNGVHIHLT